MSQRRSGGKAKDATGRQSFPSGLFDNVVFPVGGFVGRTPGEPHPSHVVTSPTVAAKRRERQRTRTRFRGSGEASHGFELLPPTRRSAGRNGDANRVDAAKTSDS